MGLSLYWRYDEMSDNVANLNFYSTFTMYRPIMVFRTLWVQMIIGTIIFETILVKVLDLKTQASTRTQSGHLNMKFYFRLMSLVNHTSAAELKTKSDLWDSESETDLEIKPEFVKISM